MKSRAKSKKPKPDQKLASPSLTLIKGIRRFLDDNCKNESYYGEFHGALRSRDLAKCYRLAESLSTAVYGDAFGHLKANQLAAMLLKTSLFSSKELGFKKTPTEAAKEKFFDAEEKCRRVNGFFRSHGWMSTPHASNITWMQNYILRVIGEKPNLAEIYSKCGFSSGANVGVHGNATHLGNKLSKRWSCTPTALSYFNEAVGYNFHLTEYLLRNNSGVICLDRALLSEALEKKIEIVTSNSVCFVPKTAKTERSIAIEPLCNAYLQKGVDFFLRNRLKAFGYDLTDQGKNQAMARKGSISGCYATIDLKSASDTISTGLAETLLPPDWFAFLNRIRSPAYTLDGEVRSFHKFVSMGNGFCFPLETLFFAAAVSSLTRDNICYGDDIVVSTEHAPGTIKLLKCMGFRTNVDKTFVRGPFRESCGADWYRGRDVRPVYMDNQLSEVSHLMVAHNATYRSEEVARLLVGWREILRSVCPPKLAYLRPPWGSQQAEHRWDDPRVTNGAFTVPLDVFMGSTFALWNRKEQRWSWREHLYAPVDDDDFPLETLERYISFLSGSLGGSLNLRYTTKRLAVIK